MATKKKNSGKRSGGAKRSAPQKTLISADTAVSDAGADVLDMKEAIKLLHTTQPTFYRWLREGQIKGMKAGRQWRFRREDIERFMRGEGPRVELAASISPLIESLEKRLRDTGKKKIPPKGSTPLETVCDLMIHLGIALSASDIHLEVFQDSAVLRYRVDGVLHEAAKFDTQLMPPVAEHWKRMAKCNVQEKQLPQDGRIMLENGERKINIYVHILPTVFGETVIARILTEEVENFSLQQLPIRPGHRKTIIRHLESGYGLIICCGPSGSGKTTTTYAALNHLNVPGRKLVSVEDPVEYHLRGVSQVQVSERKGLTIAAAVKSLLRSDPDVIIVGEIRDPETAHLCHAAALTGHLVLTSLHSDDAPRTLIRLTDMGIPPFLIADALRLIIAQRLVRKICTHCAKETKPTSEEIEKAMRRTMNGGLSWESLPKRWLRPVGCDQCRGLGYRGRTCVNELLEMSGDIRAALIRGASTQELREIAIKQGMTSLAAEAVLRAANGETTLQEALGVIPTA